MSLTICWMYRLPRSYSATYKLTYSGLGSNVTQAHLHFGKVHVAGGIYAFLCTNLGNGPAGTPACPPTGGTVTGTLTPASIVAVARQNITAGDFNALLSAVGSNTTYANIHTVKFPAGEIRGQAGAPGAPAHQGIHKAMIAPGFRQ
jgi:CHRD domain